MKFISSFVLSLILSFFALNLKAQLFENFEEGSKTSYAPFAIELSTGDWMFDDALVGTLASDKKNGLKSARIRDGFIEMEFDYPLGLSEVSFYAANFSSDTGGAVQVSYSDDSGENWQPLGSSIALSSELSQYSIPGSVEGNVRLRFSKSAGNRINIDDVLISSYIETSEEPSLLLRINEIPYPSGSTFDFGLNTGYASAMLQLRNMGEQDLIISSFQIDGEEFTVEGDLNITLEYLETAGFVMEYQSATPGIKTGSLSLTTNDPDNQQFIINLSAETLDTSQPVPIADARLLPQGTEVTITGWVTVASQFAGPVYLQDETAGIAWFNFALMREEWLVGAVIGDSIVLTGEIGNYNNLLQIVNDTHFEIFPESNREIEPIEITIEQMNTGNYEGLLAKISELEFDATGTFAGHTNYVITDATAEGELRIDQNTNISGTLIPNGPVEVTGAVGRFYSTNQILPRFTQDIEILSGPIILSAPPYEVSATSNSISFAWETKHAGHSEIRYGTTTALELGNVMDETHKTYHNLTISNLDPATIYKVQLRSAFDADTSATNLYITSTGSPAGTTGEILTFFNKDVVHDLATFREADQNIDLSEKLIEYIQMAEQTAEFAFYNISGDVGANIASEIMEAHNRGVDIRVIVSGHTGTTNEIVTQLTAAGVKAVQSLGDAQMHNKFAVFDAHHSNPSRPFAITSSWNATDLGTYNQFQNMVVIQDVALARAYLREFNQMWGGDSGMFNPNQALFSYEKNVVNPTVFWIGEDETKVEVYFSPQANVEAQINRTLTSAEATIDLALNLITRRNISNTMRSRFNEGISVRGVIGSVAESGSEFAYLSTWADVHHFSQADFGLLHHKYAIIDGLDGSLDSKVITGSHNWSANANFTNDENIVIIHNPRVANEYFQEFAARYWQAGGEADFDVTTSVEETIYDQSVQPELQNFPNPFSNLTHFSFNLSSTQKVSLKIFDVSGREVASPANHKLMEAGRNTLQWDASQFDSGIYFYRIHLEEGQVFSGKMILLR
ncbi:MAG: T9SS type A sorting domain-containing protein [Bacteroidales bacterium]|nr:T9SS type A sorting domain-containing protein [Bacteroidales bacterium]